MGSGVNKINKLKLKR